MKELSTEEKARRYDEAIAVAKSNYETIMQMNNDCTFAKEGIVNTFHHIFPELKETIDGEKIRKTLIENFKWFGDNYPEAKWGKDNDLLVKNIIAWLEKQGEQEEPTWSEYDDIHYNKCLSYLESISPRKEDIEWFKSIRSKWYHSEDQINNVAEPKFHEGDWIVQENIGVYKVIEVCKSWYEVVDNKDKHYSIGFDKEYMCHLWTIKDAKDGDVLVYEEEIFMIKSYALWNKIVYHCWYGGGILHIHSIYDYLEREDFDKVHPATKEQRDILFQKMIEENAMIDIMKNEVKTLR